MTLDKLPIGQGAVIRAVGGEGALRCRLLDMGLIPGTRVEITARAEDGEAVLTFRNFGRTIPPEKLERLFEQFFRLDESRASRTGGAGLGLAIARQIVELHGGTITAESADNQVLFTLHLPFSQENRKNSEAKP